MKKDPSNSSAIEQRARMAQTRSVFATQRYFEHLSTPIAGVATPRPARERVVEAMRLWAAASEGAEPSAELQRALLMAPESLWVWSDAHIGHENIISHAQRPFGNAAQMNEALLGPARALGAEQVLLSLGDFGMGQPQDAIAAFRTLGCRKWTVIGNHDLQPEGKLKGYASEWSAPMAVAFLDGLEIWFTHYPIRDAMLPQGVINAHGHTHQIWMGKRHMCCCVEHWEYRPWRFLDALRYWQQHGKGPSTPDQSRARVSAKSEDL